MGKIFTCKAIAYFDKAALFILAVLILLLSTCNMERGLGEKVDIEKPNIVVESHSNGAYVKGTILLSGIATDDIAVKEVNIIIGGNSKKATVSKDSGWSYSLNTTGYSDGRQDITLQVVDTSDKELSIQLLLIFDNILPAIIFVNPDPDSLVNGEVDIKGVSTDNTIIETVELNFKTLSGADNWVTLAGTYNWSERINTNTYGNAVYAVNDPPGSQVWLWQVQVRVTDIAGNRRTSSLTMMINQDTNKPVIGLSNLDINGTAAENMLESNPSILGTVIDDKKVDKDSIQIRFDGGAWAPVSDPPGQDLMNVSWRHDLSGFANGIHTFSLRAYDLEFSSHPGVDTEAASYPVYPDPAYANWNMIGPVNFSIDSSPPEVAITAPAAAEMENQTFDISGNAFDSNGIQLVEVSIQAGAYAPVVSTALPGDPAFSTWSFEVPVGLGPGEYGNGTYTYQVRATDLIDKTTTIDRQVIIDITAPTVTLLTPAGGSTINGTVNISGISQDNNAVMEVYQWVGPFGTTPPADIGSWTLLAGKYNFSSSLDSTGYADGNYSLHIQAKDSAANFSTIGRLDFSIAQASDRPVISLSNLDPLGALNDNGLGRDPSVIGTISDDDSVDRTTIEIKIDTDPWIPVSSPPASDGVIVAWSHDFTGFGQGPYTISIRARDVNSGGSFAADDYNWQELGPVDFMIDYGPPDLAITAPANGALRRDTFAITGTSADSNGVLAVEISINGGAFTPVSTSDDYANWSSTFSVAANGSTDGDYTYQIRATDNSGALSTKDRQFVVDASPPLSSFLQPAASSVLNGDAIIVRGTTSDNRAVAAVYFWVGAELAPVPPGTGSWTLLGGTYTWNTLFNSTLPAYPDGDYRIYVKAIDTAGNEETPVSVAVSINQATDRPTINFSNMDPAASYSDNAIGVDARIIGTAEDDDGIDASTFEINVDSGGWIPVSNPPVADGLIVSWSHSLSAAGEGQHSILVRVRDINSDGGFEVDDYNWQETGPVNFIIDLGPPALILTSPANGQIKNSNFQITGQATDANGIQSVELTFDGGTTWYPVTTVDAFANWTYDFPVNPDGSDDGDYAYQVKAVDNSLSATTQDMQVTVDATIPFAEFLLPADSSTVNGAALDIKGTSSDNRAISAVYLWIGESIATPPADLDSWLTPTGTYSWAYVYNTTVVTGPTAYTVHLRSKDTAGNLSATVTRDMTIDQESDRPVIGLSNLDTAATAAENLLESNPKVIGTVIDDDSVQAGTIMINLDSTSYIAVSTQPGSDGVSLSWQHNLSALAEGVHTLRIRAEDTASGGSYLPTDYTWNQTPLVNFTIDKHPPSLALSGAPAAGAYISADVTGITISASDANGVKPSRAFDSYAGLLPVVAEHFDIQVAPLRLPDDTVADIPARDLLIPADGNICLVSGNGIYYAFNAQGSGWVALDAEPEGSRVITVTAIDNFDKKTDIQLNMTVDTTAPGILITTPAEGSWTNLNALSASGTASDANAVSAVEFSLNNTDWSPANGTVTWNTLIDLSGLSEGVNTPLYFRSTDIAGNRTNTLLNINIDRTAALLAESLLNTANTVYKNTDYTLSGTLSDNLAGSLPQFDFGSGDQAYIELRENGGAAQLIAVDTGGNWSWTKTFAAGTFTYTLAITDRAGNAHSLERNVVADNTDPSLSIDAIAGSVSGTISLSGASDDAAGSGVALVQYQLGGVGGAWTNASGTASWLGSLDLSSALEGSVPLYARAFDRAGNFSANESIILNIDRANPRVTETNYDSNLIRTKTDITFTGIADDAAETAGRNAATITLSWSKDGGTVNDVVITPDADGVDDIPGNADDGLWSWNLLTSNGDGLYTLNLVVVDAVGKSASVSRIAQIDTTGPTLVVSAPVADESTSQQLYDIAGTARDTGGVGFDGSADVEYNLDGSGWTALALSGINWSLAEVDLGATEGAHTFEFRANDVLNNETLSGPLTLYYDLAPPSLSETTVSTTDTQYRNVDLLFGGNAADTYSLAGLSLSLDGGPQTTAGLSIDLDGVDNINGNADDGGPWSYTADVDTDGAGPDAGLSEGTHTIVFTATDLAGKTSSLTRTIYVDTTAPALTGVTDLSVGWRTNESNAISGTASDSGSGVLVVEYQIDGGGWNPLTGTTSWSGTIAVPTGVHTLEIRSRDKVGNLSAVNSQTVRIDSASPVISITAPVTLVQLNGILDLAVSLNGTDIGGSGIESVALKIGVDNFASPDATGTLNSGDANNGSWTATLPAVALLAQSEGQVAVYCRAVDFTGRGTTISFPVFIDKSNPSVTFDSHADDDPVNRTVTLSGTAADTQGLNTVTIEIYNDELASWETLSSTGLFSWSVASFNTVSFDTADYDTNSGTPGIQVQVRATSADRAGNTAAVTRTLDIDQHGDRPVIQLNNIDTSGTSVLKLATTVYGSVSDDDGVLTSFEVSLNDTNWTALPLSGGGWQVNVTTLTGYAGDGIQNLYFRATDRKSTIFRTTDVSSLLKPRVLVDNTPSYSEAVVTFSIDTVTPEIFSTLTVDRAAPFDFVAGTTDLTTNLPFGGTSAVFALRVLTKDVNGIASVNVNLPGLGDYPGAANGTISGYTIYDTGSIDISGLTDGSIEIVVTVTDNSGLSATATRSVIIDNTEPSITHLSPLETEVVNGNIEVKGLASDSGSGLASLEYKVGHNHASESWTLVSGSLFNWKIDFKDANKIDNFAGLLAVVDAGTDTFTIASHSFSNDEQVFIGARTLPAGISVAATYYIVNAAADTFQIAATQGGAAINLTDTGTDVRVSSESKDLENDEIWDLPLLIRAVDTAGNVYTSSVGDYTIQIDPSGDKPRVTIVYPDPDNTNRVLGGTIRIFGTAEDDDGISEVYMQIDVDGDNDFDAADIDSQAVDWYNSGLGRLVSGTVSWNKTINAAGEFNPPGADTRNINFRVRVKDIYGLYGPWSDPQLIQVDKNVPIIGSTNPLTLEQGIATKSYVRDIWLKGNWTLTGSIEDESGISDILISGDINGSLAGNPGWFSALASGYDIALPLATIADSTGSISFTIRAFDDSEPANETTTNISIQYDNEAPALNSYTGDTPVMQSNKTYSLESSITETGSGFGRVAFYFRRNDVMVDALDFDRLYNPMANNVYTDLSTLTQIGGLYYLAESVASRSDTRNLVDTDLIGNSNVRVGGLIRIGDIDRLITAFDPVTGTVQWADEVDTSLTSYYIAYAQIVDNQTIETPVWNGDTLNSIINDDGDFMVESVERSGGLYDWTASINSKNIPDGPVEIHYVAFDTAGNWIAGSVSTSIANNNPLLAAITLGTDLNGDGVVDASETEPAYSALDGEGNQQALATVLSDAFVAKGKMEFDLDILGGNGQLQYALTENGAGTIHSWPQNLRTTEVSAIDTITVTLAELSATGEGFSTFIFAIWDSTEESTPGTDSLYAQLTVPLIIDVVDGVPPVSVISPFFYNSSSDNSLYNNSRNNGHIEVTGVIDGTDPDISGQVSIRGTAYDDTRIDTLYMRIDNTTMTNGTTKDFNAQTYIPIATYAGGIWTGVDKFATEGWKSSAADLSINQSGHCISWQLDWNTAFDTDLVGLNRNIRIVAEDKGVNPSGFTLVSSGDQTLNNIPYYTVDIVPYISAVSTDTTGIRDRNVRSAGGKYVLQVSNSAADYVRIYGFNLNPITSGIRVSSDPDGLVGTILQGETLTLISTAADYKSITAWKNATESGYLTVVGGSPAAPIPSINNLTSNALDENKEPSTIQDNPTLTDDRYLSFFDVFDTGFTNGYYPEMIMNGNLPVFGYVNDSAADDLQFSRGQIASETGIGGTVTTTVFGLIRGLGFQYYAMARDASGIYHQLSSSIFNSMQQYYIYGEYASDYPGNWGGYVDNGGATQVYWGGFTGNRANNDSNDALVLDELDYSPGLLVGRYKNPRMLATGSSTTAGTAAGVYMSFYDTNNSAIIFRNMQVGRAPSGGVVRNFNNTTGTNMTELTGIISGDNTRHTVTTNASQYYDMGLTDGNIAVFVYYDEASSQLKLTYSTTAVTGANPSAAISFATPTIVNSTFIGSYVSMAIQTDGNAGTPDAIHIAAHDSGGADLAYIRFDDYTDTTPEVVLVDANLSVGLWTDIAVNSAGIPYIGYYNSSETGTKDSVKLAYYLGSFPGTVEAGVDADGDVTGNWEFMTIPANNSPNGGIVQFMRVNIGFNSAGNPVVGYLADDIEYAKFLPEVP